MTAQRHEHDVLADHFRRPSMVQVEFTFDDLPDGWAVVQANVTPDVPAKLRGHPDDWEPAEPGDVELTRAWLHRDDGEEPLELWGRVLDTWSRQYECELGDAAREAAAEEEAW